MQGLSRVEYLGHERYKSEKTQKESVLISFWDGNNPIKAKVVENSENMVVLNKLTKMQDIDITYELKLGKYTNFNILKVEEVEE